MKRLLFILALGSLSTATAVPAIREGSVKMSSTGDIEYFLEVEPAVVTVDVVTNGVSIGASHLLSASGDVGVLVQPGAHKIQWRVRKELPDLGEVPAKAVLTAWAANNPPPYMVLSMDGNTVPHYYAETNAIPGWGVSSNRLYKTDKIIMRKIPAAGVRWRMGSPPDEPCRDATRETAHWVTLTESFYIGVYPCTQKQYLTLTGNIGGQAFKDYADYDYRPVGKIPYAVVRGYRSNGIDWPSSGTNVAPTSVIDWVRRKSLLDTLDLPTEAQWEFACRAGEGAALYNGKELPSTASQDGVAPALDPLAWHGYVSAVDGVAQTHEAGLKDPNGYGLYDMLGNVLEWCLDWDSEGAAYSDGSPVTDPKGATAKPVNGDYRICRGGSYDYSATASRAAARSRGSDENSWFERFGFRFCCPALAK